MFEQELSFRLGDREQPQNLSVPLGVAAVLELRSEGIRKAHEHAAVLGARQPRPTDGDDVADAETV